jgi:photosystem II stability/assembly factor-like uncharacterized protein
VSLDEWWMLGTAHCLAGSGTCSAIVRTTNGGSTFAGIPSPPVGSSEVTQLRFADPEHGYAFDPELWDTTNGGATWEQVATPGPVGNLEVADGEAYALDCVVATCESKKLLRTPVGSDDWQQVSTPVPLGYQATFTVSGTNLYILSGAGPHGPGVLVYSPDQGVNVSQRIDPCTAGLSGTLSAAADGSSVLWAACPTGTMAEASLSTNGGTSWRTATKTGKFANTLGITAASSSVALAWPAQQDVTGALERTTNGGATYSVVIAGSSSTRATWAGFSDPARAYALVTPDLGAPNSSSQLFESNDGGATWQVVVIRS